MTFPQLKSYTFPYFINLEIVHSNPQVDPNLSFIGPVISNERVKNAISDLYG